MRQHTIATSPQFAEDIQWLKDNGIAYGTVIKKLVHDYVSKQKEMSDIYDKLDRSVGHDSYEY